MGDKGEAEAVKVESEGRGEEQKRLFRSRENRIIGGVAGGIGEYLGIDPTVIRILWVLFALIGGTGIIAYIAALIIIPERPAGEKAPEVPRNVSSDTGLIIGIVLAGLGLWLLFRNLGLIPDPLLAFLAALRAAFWPIILILVGVLIIAAATRGQGRGLTISTEGKTLYRSRSNRMIAGVAGGIAEYFRVDPTLVRLAWAALFIINFFAALIAYIIMAIVVPEEPETKAT